ncbi:OsmC family protein [Brevibacillus dissolubilis]|uniref:OsmC family protein n=1 Tax=Brevibacillus dissolubilis TaxID=1844116 RepID=UPI001117678C|nr:OsmC family protein [Brevibacillus dissolubilis]
MSQQSQHSFTLNATWEGGRLGAGHLKAKGLDTQMSVPTEFGGPNTGTNPEELLIGSAMTCYMITLAAILEKRNFKVISLTLQSEGIVGVEAGNTGFRQIIHRPTIVLGDGDEKTIEVAQQAAHRAEEVCMISKAMRGNIDFIVEPTVRIGQNV